MNTLARNNAVLTVAVGFTSKRSLFVKFAVAAQAPGSGAERRNQELDEVSTAFSAAQPPRTTKASVLSGAFLDWTALSPLNSRIL